MATTWGPFMTAVAFSLAAHAVQPMYTVTVTNRSLTNAPLLAYPNTSFAPDTLNPAWIPLPGKGNEGGGLFFRTIAAPGTSVYNAIGFVKAASADGLAYAKATAADLLHDGPNRTQETDGADPRAIYRRATGEYLLIYQGGGYAGRHSVLSRTRTPLDLHSWRRDPQPLFAHMTERDGTTPLKVVSTVLAACNASEESQQWAFFGDVAQGLLQQRGSGLCLSVQRSEWDSDLWVGLEACNETAGTLWYFDSSTKQLRALPASSKTADWDTCLDVNGGQGPQVSWYGCHNESERGFAHQQFALDVVRVAAGSRGHGGGGSAEQMNEARSPSSSAVTWLQLRSLSAAGKQCVSVEASVPNDSGSSLWFPHDTATQAGRAFSIATFGELRGGNLSLVSSADLVHWRFEHVILRSRPGHWDDAALSTGPSPQRLSDGNWLLLYDIDNLWPVRNPKPFPLWGRCALGWAVLDGKNISRVLARAEAPLVYAQLPWELSGFTDKVVYVTGIKPQQEQDSFVVFAGAGDRVVEAFSIRVAVP